MGQTGPENLYFIFRVIFFLWTASVIFIQIGESRRRLALWRTFVLAGYDNRLSDQKGALFAHPSLNNTVLSGFVSQIYRSFCINPPSGFRLRT